MKICNVFFLMRFQDPSGNPLHVVTTTNLDGTYSCCFLPEETGIHQVSVNYGKKAVPDSQFLVKVVPFGICSFVLRTIQ